MGHEKQTSPSRTVAEVQPLNDGSLEHMRHQAEVQTGSSMHIKREVLVYEPWDRDASVAIGTMINGLVRSNPALQGVGYTTGELDIEGSDDKQPFTAFASSTAIQPDQLDMASKTIVHQCNQILSGVESPIRLPDL